jgi:membrane protein YdbS with pleckstrin-like domain
MDRELTQRFHPHYLSVLRIRSLITHGLLFGLTAVYLILASIREWKSYPGWLAAGLLVVSVIVYTWVFPPLRRRRFAFEVFEEELELRSGLFFIHNTLVPMVRVQHVELESGPLLRAYGLAEVSVVTAATTHTIAGLTQRDAEEIKRRIGTLARVADDEN